MINYKSYHLDTHYFHACAWIGGLWIVIYFLTPNMSPFRVKNVWIRHWNSSSWKNLKIHLCQAKTNFQIKFLFYILDETYAGKFLVP